MGSKSAGASAGMLALVAFLVHMLAGTGSEQHTGHKAEPQAMPDLSAFAAHSGAKELSLNVQGPWNTTQQYFHRDPAVPTDLNCLQQTANSCATSVFEGLYAFPSAVDRSNVHALIATVPDPLHTRMSIETDRYLDAIQQAAFDSGYELATQWLPWGVKAAAEKTGAVSGNPSANFDWERLPGLLLFRPHFFEGPKTPSLDSLLLVFIVGETPTAGVNGYQFDTARATIQALFTASPRTLYVAGPNFSGSFPSVTNLLQDLDSSWQHVEIHSGAVANDAYAAEMLKKLKGKSISFYGFVPPSSSFHAEFKQLVNKLHLVDSQVAEIVETETGFAAASQDNGDKAYRIIRYPRDIAQLRNIYNDAAFASSAGQTGTASPPPVDFSLKDTQAGEDEFPTFSTSHTPISQNAVLEQIAQRIKQDHVRLVSLSASNVFDTLFLANFLARNCADTRVVLPSADLLFVEDAASGGLSGLMALSPFPLFPNGTPVSKSGPGSDTITFASSDEAAEFNAVLSLVGTMGKDLASAIASNRQDYGPPLSKDGSPSAWLLVLSSRGWMPVDLFSEPNNSHGITWWDPAARSERKLEDALSALKAGGPLWLVLCAVIALTTGFVCYQLWRLKLHPEERVWNPFCLEDPERSQSQSGAKLVVEKRELLGSRYFCMNACFSNLAVANALLLCPMLAENHLGGFHYWVVAILLCIAFAWSAITSVLLVGPWIPLPARSGAGTALNLGLQAIAVSTIAVWCFCCFFNHPASSMFNFRTLTLAASVCPLWPLLLGTVGLFGMAFFQLCRFTWCDRRQPYLDTSLFDSPLQNEFTDTKKRLERSLMSSTGSGVWKASEQEVGLKKQLFGMLSPFVLSLCVIFLLDHTLYSFESRAFTYTVEALFAMLAVFTAANLVRYLTCWNVLRVFLVNLNGIVLGRFFTQVSEFSGGSGPVWIRDVKLMSLSTVVNGYVALHNLDSLRKNAIEARAPTYRDALKMFLMTPTPPSNRDRRKFVEAYRAFRRSADDISVELGNTVLLEYWKNNKLDFVAAEDSGEPAAPTAKPKSVPAKAGAQRDPVNIEKAILRQSWTVDRLEFVLLRHAAEESESPAEHRLAFAAAAGSSRPQSASVDRGNSVSSASWALGSWEIDTHHEPENQQKISGPSKDEYELASRYVALHYSTYIGYVLHQLQNLLVGSSVCFALLMLGLNSFAFQAPQTLFHLASATFIIGGIFVLKALAQIERDPILSRLSGSKEGELGKDFYIRVLTFGTVPILTVLATEFPSIGQYISGLIQPMSAALH
jgi:hypothetical protein